MKRGRKRGNIRINVNDIVGKRFGKLTVESYVGSYCDLTLGGEKRRHAYFVKCECGTVKMAQRGNIVVSRSCGCGKLW